MITSQSISQSIIAAFDVSVFGEGGRWWCLESSQIEGEGMDAKLNRA